MEAVLGRLFRLLPTNPIVLRLQWAGGRRRRDLYLRSGFLLAMILLLVVTLLGGRSDTMRELARQGATAFEVVSYGMVALIALVTPIFMAGAIVQESNPRTWEILLTTPLSSVQIVLGNVFGRLFFVLALLLATVPLFAVTQMFGGVPGAAILASYQVAAQSALLVACIAVTLCVTRAAGKRAVLTFYSSVMAYLFATYALDMALRTPVAVGTIADYTTAATPLNPFLALEVLLSPSTYVVHDVAAEGRSWLGALWFGSPIAAQGWLFVGTSLLLMAWSTLRVRRVGSREPSQRRRSSGLIRRAPNAVGTNPIAWRELHLRGQSRRAVVVRVSFVVIGLLIGITPLILHRTAAITSPELRLALAAILGAEVVIITLTAINTSATAVSREREDGSLDILLTTPIQPGPYISGKLLGLVRYLLPLLSVPVVTLGLAAGYVLFDGFGVVAGVTVPESVGTGTQPFPVVLPWAALALPVCLLGYTSFCVMVGLQWSIRSAGTIGSVLSAVAVVGMMTLVISSCAFGAGSGIPVVGAALNGLSPLNVAFAAVLPAEFLGASMESDAVAQRSLLGGAVMAAATFGALVYGMHAQMKRSFMMTVRRLAGTA